jgi:hypothetical protein
MESTSPAARTGPFLPRALALVALVTTLDLWGSRHFGIGFQHPGVLAGVFATIAFAVGFVGKIVPKSEGETARAWLAVKLRGILSAPVVGGLGALTLILMATGSSVTVLDESGSGTTALTLYPLDRPADSTAVTLRADPGYITMPVWTNPFGRAFRVRADGFVSGSVVVYPVTGLRLVLGRDLRPLPSLLLRPSFEALQSLEGGGKVVISRPGSELRLEIPGRRSSFVIGRPRPIPAGMVEDWRQELIAEGAPAPVVARTILDWKTPHPVPSPAAIAPDATIVAEVWSAADQLVARGEVVVGSDPLIDVPLPVVPAGGNP